MSFITIFTSPKPFTNPHIAVIQRNAIRSWSQLGKDISILLIGNEEGLAKNAAELGVRHLDRVERNSYGTPYIKSLFNIARQTTKSPLLAYINTDIILLPDFVEACQYASQQRNQFLMVGQRWDLNITEELDFSPTWAQQLKERCQKDGKLHPRGGSDYFVFPRHCYSDIPALVVGRAGWDNWMIYEARMKRWATIDATESIHIIHQEHDYSHLPNSQPHYRLPESIENVRIAGDEKAIFTLLDADCRLVDRKIQSVPSYGKKFWREFEIFPLITLKSEWLWRIINFLFHPIRSYKKYRAKIRTQ